MNARVSGKLKVKKPPGNFTHKYESRTILTLRENFSKEKHFMFVAYII
jgi:hypothetical protein